jgi:hypothetical protein
MIAAKVSNNLLMRIVLTTPTIIKSGVIHFVTILALPLGLV